MAKITYKKKIILFLILFFLACLVWAIIETYTLPFHISEEVFFDDDISQSFRGKKIVLLADFHRDFYFSTKRMQELTEQVNALEPDIVIFGGDYIDNNDKNLAEYIKELASFNAPLGRYAILGNHDYFANLDILKAEMEKNDILLLDNSAVWVKIGDEQIKIGGVGDYYTLFQDIEPTLEGLVKDDFAILLSHNPDFAEDIKNDKIDLVLSGHLHGGQITFFGIFAPWLPSSFGQKYRAGLAYTDFTRVITTKGVGTTVIPLRFFARPEITLISLK